jgi:hypothetical protein
VAIAGAMGAYGGDEHRQFVLDRFVSGLAEPADAPRDARRPDAPPGPPVRPASTAVTNRTHRRLSIAIHGNPRRTIVGGRFLMHTQKQAPAHGSLPGPSRRITVEPVEVPVTPPREQPVAPPEPDREPAPKREPAVPAR